MTSREKDFLSLGTSIIDQFNQISLTSDSNTALLREVVVYHDRREEQGSNPIPLNLPDTFDFDIGVIAIGSGTNDDGSVITESRLSGTLGMVTIRPPLGMMIISITVNTFTTT